MYDTRCNSRSRQRKFSMTQNTPLYVANFVKIIENIWFANTEPYEVIRRTEEYFIESFLFAASNADMAFDRASEMIGSLSDANNDGPGDRTNIRCLGIHQLEKIDLFGLSFDEAVRDVYGLDVGRVTFNEVTPTIRKREELDVFREYRRKT